MVFFARVYPLNSWMLLQLCEGMNSDSTKTRAPRLPPAFVDLLILDPPYNLTKNYHGNVSRRYCCPGKDPWKTSAKVGLTGGIGSGKSAVAACFAELGVRVIDADAVAREITAPGAAQFAEVAACFGAGIVGADGAIDRKKLGAVVFASPAKRKQLEAILHPPIRAEMHARAARAAGAYCVLDIPLLVESGQYREMQRVAVVLRNSRGMRDADIRRIMRSQASEQARLAAADDVIDNNGAIEAIETQVAALHHTYMELFADG